MSRSDRAAVRLGSVLSVLVGVWALFSVLFPFGLIGGAVGALFGLVFGVLALFARAWGRWRKTAVAGIAIRTSSLLPRLSTSCFRSRTGNSRGERRRLCACSVENATTSLST